MQMDELTSAGVFTTPMLYPTGSEDPRVVTMPARIRVDVHSDQKLLLPATFS